MTKIGGQPVWLEEAQWPFSRDTGEPMQFLGQFTLGGGRSAYVFMGADDLSAEPEGGENAVVIQRSGRLQDFVTVERGPAPGEVVTFFRERPNSRVVMGNHERKLWAITNYVMRIPSQQCGTGPRR
ncbi:hypothetical protein ABGB18_44030 [Nonomuraea sp. B12E4]|uniref:hypothetical protein n=1 Tax=Nonomuraea sp. B12E4 TaxID=3153564 RepID=UPI00325F920E